MPSDVQFERLVQTSIKSDPKEAVTVVSSTIRSGEVAKWVFDKVFAFSALLFLAPFILVIVIVILIEDGRPVFFRHKRVGKDGKPFHCLKFRTMYRDAPEQLARILATDPVARAEWEANQKLSDDPRITCVGEFFRKTSLDELPQFWNVLRGEMSVVGPRPIVEDEARHYGEHYADYLSVKPGITGLWQVNGRSNTTYPERVAMDCDYVRRRSLKLDLQIILQTVRAVLRREGSV